MNNRCGCEDGGDCTKTTVCAIELALNDQQGYIERLETVLNVADDVVKYANQEDLIALRKAIAEAKE